MKRFILSVPGLICYLVKLLVLFLNPIRIYRLHDERGKREIAENVAVSKARELDVQKRTSVMVMSSLSQSICIESISATGQIQGPTDTLDYATRVC